MAVYSMTGYASASAAPPAGSESAAFVSVELRSVNGRFLDLSFRMPDDLRGLEPALRDLVAGAFRRGKIEMRVSTARDTDDAWPAPQPDQINRLMRLESTVRGWMSRQRGRGSAWRGWCCCGSGPARRRG